MVGRMGIDGDASQITRNLFPSFTLLVCIWDAEVRSHQGLNPLAVMLHREATNPKIISGSRL